MENQPQNCPESIEMVPRSAPKATLEGGPQNGGRVKMKMEAFWCHLAISGGMLGPSWAPRDSKNQAFWGQVLPKTLKMMSKGRSLKNLEKTIKKCSENVSF